MTSPSATEADVEALLRLADRVEREPASRDMDCFIAAAIFPEAAARLQHPSATFNVVGIHTEGKTWAANYPVSHYTSSIDAAVALVPEHYSYELTFSAAGKGALRRARLWDWRRSPRALDPDNEWSSETKSSPAAALCAAALRARAALGEAGGKEEG